MRVSKDPGNTAGSREPAPELVIKPLTIEEAEVIYRKYLVNDFPADEVKPLSRIRRSWKKGMYQACGAYQDEELIGYAFFVTGGNGKTALLDYFAILEPERDRGYGGAFLKQLSGLLIPEKFRTVWIESEDPEYAEDDRNLRIRERRVAFYRKNGAVDTGLRYSVFGVRYIVFSMGRIPEEKASAGKDSEDKAVQDKNEISTMAGNERSQPHRQQPALTDKEELKAMAEEELKEIYRDMLPASLFQREVNI